MVHVTITKQTRDNIVRFIIDHKTIITVNVSYSARILLVKTYPSPSPV